MKDKSAASGAVRGHTVASGPTASPDASMLKKCLLFGIGGLAVMVVLAWILTDIHGVLSVVFGSVLVMAFFGLSLFAGHLAGKWMPSAVMGVYVLMYLVKVIGFAAVLFALGTPTWLNKPWFAIAAVVSVLLWQLAEVLAFRKIRFLIYDDEETAATTTDSKEAQDGR